MLKNKKKLYVITFMVAICVLSLATLDNSVLAAGSGSGSISIGG